MLLFVTFSFYTLKNPLFYCNFGERMCVICSYKYCYKNMGILAVKKSSANFFSVIYHFITNNENFLFWL